MFERSATFQHNIQSATVAISVRNVRKAYKIYEQPLSFLVELVTGQKRYREKEVLRDISLEITRGEVVGIVGRNGAGKSTLLKMIAGGLAPTEGRIKVHGRVSAILELGTGFNYAYTGRDNVIMSGLMRGMSESDVRRKFDAIVAFAGLEDVIDQPVNTYSSGMQARLAFAAAVAVEADIIIIDEALAAGDIRFTARSLRRVREICESGVTALFVSQQTYHVMQMCTRAIWIDEGRIRMDGNPLEICRAYEYEMHEAVARDEGRLAVAPPAPPLESAAKAMPDERSVSTVALEPQASLEPNVGGCTSAVLRDRAEVPEAQRPTGASVNRGDERVSTSGDVEHARGSSTDPPPASDARHFSTNMYRIISVEFRDGAGIETNRFRFGEPFTLRVEYECLLDVVPKESCGLAVALTSVPEHQAVMYFNTNYPHSDQELLVYDEQPFRQYRGKCGVIEAHIPYLQLRPAEYLVSLGILPNRQDLHEFYEYRHLAYRIAVLPNGFPEPSVFYAQVNWTNGPTR